MKQEAQPGWWCLFLSIFHLFLYFLFICDIKIIYKQSAFNLYGSSLFSSIFLICYPLFFLAHSAKSPGQSRALWLANQWRGIFSEKSPLPATFFTAASYADPSKCLLNHCWETLWPKLSFFSSDLELNMDAKGGRTMSKKQCQISLHNVAVFWLGWLLVWRNRQRIPDYASAKSAINLQRTL